MVKEDFKVKTAHLHDDMLKLMYDAVTDYYNKFTGLSDEDMVRLAETANALNETNCWCCVFDRKQDFVSFVTEKLWFKNGLSSNISR
jgi:hypothetical protein